MLIPVVHQVRVRLPELTLQLEHLRKRRAEVDHPLRALDGVAIVRMQVHHLDPTMLRGQHPVIGLGVGTPRSLTRLGRATLH